MIKSLALQEELGPVFDVTLDCEDGAPVGGEAEHAHLVAEMAMSARNVFGRCGVRLHPVGHPSFGDDVATIAGAAGTRLAYVMLPKVDGIADLQTAAAALDAASPGRVIPLHALIETHAGLRQVAAIAAHPRIASLSFGLMDFVSAHRGAIPASAMSADGQFTHPLVVRAKLEVSAACHAFAKVPSHCVVTEFADAAVVARAARRAANAFGYTRMWSIHPSQIVPIVARLRAGAARDRRGDRHHRCRGRRRLGADPARRRAARPRQLPLFLADPGAREANRRGAAGSRRASFFFAARSPSDAAGNDLRDASPVAP